MHELIFRVDPSLPICWEDHETLRLGFDRAEARIPRPSAATQRLLSALTTGIPASELTDRLRRLGSTRGDWARLTSLLGNTLVSVPQPLEHPVRRLRVGVIGSVRSRDRLAVDSLVGSLGRAGFHAEPYRAEGRAPDLVVVAERFLEARNPSLLDAAGLPQLGIRFGDRSIRIGPLAAGGGGPCLWCAAMHDIDKDPALPVLSAQLFDEVPTSEPMGIEIAGALAVSLIRHWQAGSEMPSRIRLDLPVRDGLPHLVPLVEEVAPHPECGCAEITPVGADPPQR